MNTPEVDGWLALLAIVCVIAAVAIVWSLA